MVMLRDQIKAILDFRTPDPASDFFSLIDSFALTQPEIAAGVTPVNFSYPPYTAFRYMTAAQIASVIAFRAPFNGGLDVTAALQTLFSITQGNGGVYAELPYGGYCVSSLTISLGGIYKFNSSLIIGSVVTPTPCVLKLTTGYVSIYDLYLFSYWNANYHDAFWWTSASTPAPAQSVNIYGLQIQNFVSAINFGNWGGGLVTPQSENYVYGLHTRGCQSVVHSNQPEGFVRFIGGEAASSKNEWDTNNPNFGALLTFDTLVGGSAYTAGLYTDVLLTGGAGTGAYATIVVVGAAVAFVTIMHSGLNFVVGNTLSCAAASIGGSGSGFSLRVATVGGYNYAVACVLQNINGVVQFLGCDLEKTDSNVGIAIVHPDSLGNAQTEIRSCQPEMACQNFNITSGRLVLSEVAGEFWSSSTSAYLALNNNYGGSIQISSFILDKSPSLSAVDKPFIDLVASTANWDITLTDLRLENQFALVYWNGAGSPTAWPGNIKLRFQNVESLVANGGATQPVFPMVSTASYNMLDVTGTDSTGNDIATWYHVDTSGTGTLTLNADVPANTNYPASMQCAATGVTDFSSLNQTSLATCKSTGIKCHPGDQYMLSGWFRMTSAGTASVEATFANTGGVGAAVATIADQTNLLINGWTFITGLFTVPAGIAYMGVGMHMNATTVRMVGLKVSKLA